MRRILGVLAICLPWLAALAIGAWLFVLHFPPSGQLYVQSVFDGSSPWLQPFLPGQRVLPAGLQEDGWTGQRLIDDPVYASVRMPGPYDRMTVGFETRALRQPLLELGILRDAATNAYEMKPLWSEALSQGWRRVKTATREGWVREGMPDATLDTANLDRLVFWQATMTTPALNDQGTERKTYDISLRGAHDFYIIPVNGEISFDFTLQDVNRSRGGSVAALRLMKDDELLWTDAVSVSGRYDKTPAQAYSKNVRWTGLVPGVYRLAFSMDDDVFIRRISTNARRWVMGPRFYLGDVAGYGSTSTRTTSVWTNSQHLVAETFHVEGLQTVKFGSAGTSLRQTHQSVLLARLASERAYPVLLNVPQGDVRFVGDGYFSVDPTSLFLPKPRRFTDATDLDAEEIVGVVTPYTGAEAMGDGWTSVEASFDVSQAGDFAKLTLSAPNVFTRQGAVDIRSFRLSFERPALSPREWWKTVKREIVRAIRR